MKIRFYMSGRGNRKEEKIVDLPDCYEDEEIKEELENWIDDLGSNSDCIFYGWEEAPQ